MRNIIAWWKDCRRHGHIWLFDSYSLGGDWIRCAVCHTLDEYIPGLHEPKGYDYNAIHDALRKELGI